LECELTKDKFQHTLRRVLFAIWELQMAPQRTYSTVNVSEMSTTNIQITITGGKILNQSAFLNANNKGGHY